MKKYTNKFLSLLMLCVFVFALTACTVTTYGPAYNYDSPHAYRANQRFLNSGTEQGYGHYRPLYY